MIATTSKLLSTGSDCKMTKLIVLDEMIGSMTEFKQIIGRGTRLREKEGKTHFVVMDFRNVSRLFADPEWDGPIEMNDDYDPNKDTPQTPPKPSPDTPNPPVGPKIRSRLWIKRLPRGSDLQDCLCIRCERKIAETGKHHRLHKGKYPRCLCFAG